MNRVWRYMWKKKYKLEKEKDLKKLIHDSLHFLVQCVVFGGKLSCRNKNKSLFSWIIFCVPCGKRRPKGEFLTADKLVFGECDAICNFPHKIFLLFNPLFLSRSKAMKSNYFCSQWRKEKCAMIFDFFRREIFEKSPLFPTAVGTFRFFLTLFSSFRFSGKEKKFRFAKKNSGLLLETMPDNFQTITRTISRNGERGRKRPFFTFYISFYARLHARASSFGFTVSSKGSFCHKSPEEGKVKRCCFFYCFFDVPQHFL